MEFDGFIGASEVGFVHNSFNILQYQNWLMRHWLKPWSADIGGGFNMFQPGLGKKLDT